MNQLSKSAVEPRDVYWPNVVRSPVNQIMMSILIPVLITILAFVWVTPMGLVVSLINLEELAKIFPKLELDALNPLLSLFIKEILPTWIVSGFFAILPYVFHCNA